MLTASQRPDAQTMDEVDTYQMLVRAVATVSVSSQRTLTTVRAWIEDNRATGADDFEREAMLALIDGNLREGA